MTDFFPIKLILVTASHEIFVKMVHTFETSALPLLKLNAQNALKTLQATSTNYTKPSGSMTFVKPLGYLSTTTGIAHVL